MHSKSAPRRRHGGELKAQVLAECDGPGASVAAVAQTHGLNANLVHKWRRTERAKSSLTEAPQTDSGGAFGSKSATFPEYVAVAFLAVTLGLMAVVTHLSIPIAVGHIGVGALLLADLLALFLLTEVPAT